MGFMTFLHGDDRFYNNIFIQAWEEKDMISPEEENREVGTHVFEGYPTFDEWIGWFEMDKPFVSMREKENITFLICRSGAAEMYI